MTRRRQKKTEMPAACYWLFDILLTFVLEVILNGFEYYWARECWHMTVIHAILDSLSLIVHAIILFSTCKPSCSLLRPRSFSLIIFVCALLSQMFVDYTECLFPNNDIVIWNVVVFCLSWPLECLEMCMRCNKDYKRQECCCV